MSRARIGQEWSVGLPRGLGATYRLPIGPPLGFFAAAERVAYLAALGVATLACPPVSEAVPGSWSGEDGTDPTLVRRELGGDVGFAALVAACDAHRIGLCVDLFPGQLATWPGGAWWRRLLAEGRRSEVAEAFDVDWEAGAGKILLPLLDRPLAAALRAGLVRIVRRDTAAVLAVGGLELPLAGGSVRVDDELDEVLAAQHYRLVEAAAPQRNYRRIGDDDALVAVRVDIPEVFDATHQLVLHLARAGRISALRIGRLDSLREPTAYLRRLAAATDAEIVVEKVLADDEELPPEWPVRGTTGYEVVDVIGGALIDPDGERRLVAAARGEGDPEPDHLVVTTRRLAATTRFPIELETSARRLGVPTGDLAETLVRLPRQRTYLEDGPLRTEDEEAWRAVEDGTVRDVVVEAVLHPAGREATLALQQVANALAETGINTMALDRLVGPLPFCEVGGAPGADREQGVARLAAHAMRRALDGRGGFSPGTTMRSRRSEDVRCRLYALSEMPEAFERGLERFREGLELGRDGGELALETRLLAQLILGVLPPLAEATPSAPGDAAWPGEHALTRRLHDALRRIVRNAGSRSSWHSPERAYEARLCALADAALARRAALVRACFGGLVDEVARLGAVNSLASVVLRAGLPGTPDTYAGEETWRLGLDAAERRPPPDVAQLGEALAAIAGAGSGPADVAGLRRSWRDGRVKLLVTTRALSARRSAAQSFAPGAGCLTLDARGGAHARCVVALARHGSADGWAIAVATRHASALHSAPDDLPAGPAYAGLRLPLPDGGPRRFVEVLGGRKVAADHGALLLEEVLEELPVALLLSLDHDGM